MLVYEGQTVWQGVAKTANSALESFDLEKPDPDGCHGDITSLD
jgi:hypothetical protein